MGQGRISLCKFLVPCLSLRAIFTKYLINGKKLEFRDKHGFCMLSTFETKKHPCQFDLF